MAESLITAQNQPPYYDDHNIPDPAMGGLDTFKKNYHRILFQPTNAVQTRELNQMQSMLQNQIAQLGLSQINAYYGGQVIGGEPSIDSTGLHFIDVRFDNPLTADILNDYLGLQFIETRKVVNNTLVTDLKAEVLSIKPTTNGTYRIWHRYSNAGGELTGEASAEKKKFATDDLLFMINDLYPSSAVPVSVTQEDIDAIASGAEKDRYVAAAAGFAGLVGSELVAAWKAIGQVSARVDAEGGILPATGVGLNIAIKEGVFFVTGCFVHTPAQSKYYVITDGDETVDGYASLIVEESITTVVQDPTLRDNANGSYNFAAPGADRYTIKLSLALNTSNTRVLELNAGINRIFNSADKDNYGSIKYLNVLEILDSRPKVVVGGASISEQLNADRAQRTKEESGNYTVTPFRINVRNFLNSNGNGGRYTIREILQKNPSEIKDLYDAVSTNGLVENLDGADADLHTDPSTGPNVIISAFEAWLDSKMAIDIDPAIAYVDGFRVAPGSPRTVLLDKARDIAEVADTTISLVRGNYVDFVLDPEAITQLSPTEFFGTAPGIPKQLGLSIRGLEFRGVVLSSEVYDRDQLADGNIPAMKNYPAEQLGFLKFRAFVYGEFNPQSAIYTPEGFEYTTLPSSIPGGNPILDKTIKSPNKVSSLFLLPHEAINTVAAVRYSAVAVLTNPNIPTPGGNVCEFAPPTNSSFQSGLDALDIIVYDGGKYINTLTDVSDIQLDDGVMVITFSNSRIPTSAIQVLAPLDISDTDINSSSPDSTMRSKSVTAETVMEDSVLVEANVANPTNSAKIITLAQQDVLIDSIVVTVQGRDKNDPENVLNHVVIYDGQGPDFYENPVIKITSEIPETDDVGTRRVDLHYKYFTHIGSDKHYFCRNSYNTDDSSLAYEDIPKYAGISLTDYIDFRVKRKREYDVVTNTYTYDNSNLSAAVKILPNSIGVFSYKHYLGRVDTLSVTTSADFVITKGVSAIDPRNPKAAKSASGEMNIYHLDIPPYTARPEDVNKVYINHNRYTMADIAQLDARIKNLEYYSSLSLLEKEASDRKILDISSADGVERFKNGTLVDSFSGHSVGAAADLDYSCAVNTFAQTMGPSFKIHNHRMRYTGLVHPSDAQSVWPDTAILVSKYPNGKHPVYREAGSTMDGYTKDIYGVVKPVGGTIAGIWPGRSGKEVISLWDGTREIFYENLLASQSMSVQPFEVTTWNGRLTLMPSADEWIDTNTLPTFIVDLSSISDAFADAAQRDIEIYGSNETLVSSALVGGPVSASVSQRVVWTGEPEYHEGRGRQRNETTVNTSQNFTQTDSYSMDYLVPGPDSIESINFGDRLVDMSVIPWIRSRQIRFKARGFKPDTRLYAFFEEVNVTDYCSCILASNVVFNSIVTGALEGLPADSSAAIGGRGNLMPTYGTSDEVVLYNEQYPNQFPPAEMGGAWGDLITDSNGEICGYFIIPNNADYRFKTGMREFKLIDNEYNNESESDSFGRTQYSANGLLQDKQSSVGSVRIPTVEKKHEEWDIVTHSTVRKRSVSLGPIFDPIAQTFTVRSEEYPNGMFLSDVDIFIASVPRDRNIPLTIYIVPCENGIPTKTVLPGSEVTRLGSEIPTGPGGLVTGRQVTPSGGAGSDFTGTYDVVADESVIIISKPCRFTFNYPVYLKPGEEYALIVFSPSPDFRVWTSVLSEVDLNTNQIITRNPGFGVLLKSQNKSTWTPDQYRDLTCRLHKAVFPVGKIDEYRFSTWIPADGDAYPTPGDMSVAVFNGGESQGVGDYAHTFFQLFMKTQEFPATDLMFETTYFASSGAEISDSSRYVVKAGTEHYLGAALEDVGYITADARLVTRDRNVSPIIDCEGSSITTRSTLINNDISGEGGELRKVATDAASVGSAYTVGEYTLTHLVPDAGGAAGTYYPASVRGGNAVARYITKPVKLNNASEDLRVIVAVNRPSTNCNIAVYAKRKPVTNIDQSIKEIPWYRMGVLSVGGDAAITTLPVSTFIGDYTEIEFMMPNPDPSAGDPIAEYVDGVLVDGSNAFTEFSIKVVFTSTDPAQVCKIKNLTAIASI